MSARETAAEFFSDTVDGIEPDWPEAIEEEPIKETEDTEPICKLYTTAVSLFELRLLW